MERIDWAQVINWFAESGIGFIFTFLGAYVAFRFALAQDEKKRAAEAILKEVKKQEEEKREQERLRREQLLSGIVDFETLSSISDLQKIITDLKNEGR